MRDNRPHSGCYMRYSAISAYSAHSCSSLDISRITHPLAHQAAQYLSPKGRCLGCADYRRCAYNEPHEFPTIRLRRIVWACWDFRVVRRFFAHSYAPNRPQEAPSGPPRSAARHLRCPAGGIRGLGDYQASTRRLGALAQPKACLRSPRK